MRVSWIGKPERRCLLPERHHGPHQAVAPAVPTSPTSQEAAERIAASSGTLRERVLEALKVTPMTDEELSTMLGMNPSTERPRRIELVMAKLVIDSGSRRRTKSHREAVVWSVTELANL